MVNFYELKTDENFEIDHYFSTEFSQTSFFFKISSYSRYSFKYFWNSWSKYEIICSFFLFSV